MKGSVTTYLSSKSNKTGIDLDDADDLKLLMAYFNAKYIFPDHEIRIFRSSGGNGYHIEIINLPSRLSVRRLLGDCKGRMECSELRNRTNLNGEDFAISDPPVDDILFSFKSYKNRYTGKRVFNKRERIDDESIIRHQ